LVQQTAAVGAAPGRGLTDDVMDVMDVMLALASNKSLEDGVAPDPHRTRSAFPYSENRTPAQSKRE
jgi:hypothetical protein